MKPAMVRLANYVDQKLMALYASVPSWVGTPGQTINSFADLAVGIQRMDHKAIPSDDRCCVLSPADYWGLLGSQTALYINEAAKGAYREGSLGMIGGVDTNMAQNVPNHTTGSDVAGTVNAAWTAGTISYDDVKDTDRWPDEYLVMTDKRFSCQLRKIVERQVHTLQSRPSRWPSCKNSRQRRVRH